MITSMKRKHVKCSGLFLRNSCNVKGGCSQGLMAAPSMIQTPCNSNEKKEKSRVFFGVIFYVYTNVDNRDTARASY